ncbi:MAG TPA: hypothetical protein VMJ70_14950, partial [Candidatus Sulfotelmatobacter sp.]|nr:hypothetical protein [Candidatus Sulfotelmatobacter sp.]
MPRTSPRTLRRPLIPLISNALSSLLGVSLWISAAHAVLDVEDRGPVMNAGNFRMRVTNAGIIGNAFYNVGRSSDPSFEYPADSGIELLNHAELWVGALDSDGQPHVSGGPLLEWRPTLDPDDHVRMVYKGRPGSQRLVDDDGDGKIDEEILNGKDDDGDGEIDEDIAMIGDQMSAADYVDDRPEAVNYGYSTGESHHPLGLSVHQETYAWGVPGYDGICGISFHITNHTTSTIRGVYMGFFADLDSRLRSDPNGHRNDRIDFRTYSASRFDGLAKVTVNGVIPCSGRGPCPPTQCFTRLNGQVPVVEDGIPGSNLPVIALVPLEHTLDPIGRFVPSAAVAPVTRQFFTSVFLSEAIPGAGGPPALDAGRYLALEGQYPNAPTDQMGDWQVLVSCGPFPRLEPGKSLDFMVALVAAAAPESLDAVLPNLALMHDGSRLDLLPNETAHPDSAEFTVAKTGVAGHEVCLEPPPGVTFYAEPDCPEKFPVDPALTEQPVLYTPGHCIWTDADCNSCTGNNGQETIVRWQDPANMPPAPFASETSGDRDVEVGWDNWPEVLVGGGKFGSTGTGFVGYRLYKLASWKGRESLMPPRQDWELLATFSNETGALQVPLATVTDTTVAYDRILYEQKHYPIGRYRYADHEVLNGFDYIYAVTTILDERVQVSPGVTQNIRLETPLIASFDQRVTPHTAATPKSGKVTVVPNPYKARAGWDRPAVFGDPLPRHVDFMHLPAGVSTIKIYTLAGDFVAQLIHDGR